jgi:hypothetical protein
VILRDIYRFTSWRRSDFREYWARIKPNKGDLLLRQERRPRRPECLPPFDPAVDGARFVLQLQPCSIRARSWFYAPSLFVLLGLGAPRLLPDLGFDSLPFSPMETAASLLSLCPLRSLLLVFLRSTPPSPSPARSCPLRRCTRSFSLVLLPPPCCAISVLLRDLGLRFVVSCLSSVPSDPCAVLGGTRAAVVPSEPTEEAVPVGHAGVFARRRRQRLCSVPRDPCAVVGGARAAVVPSAPAEEAVPVGHAGVSARRRR